MTIHSSVPDYVTPPDAPAGQEEPRSTQIRRRSRLLIVLVAALGLLTAGAVIAVQAQAATDYTQGVTPLSATQAKIWFTPAVPSTLVDVHYTFPGQSQQDFRMVNTAGTWEKAIAQQLAAGTVVTYWFTYNKFGANQGDTPQFTYTHGGGSNQVSTPVLNPPGGNYAGPQSVTISSATAGATIRYTTDGSTPTAASALYTAPVAIAASGTLKAIAVKAGLTDSATATGVYVIGSGAAAYTYTATAVSATQAKITFRPTVTSTLVDLHYTVTGQPQQDFRMADNAGTWEQTIGSLTAGATVTFWFTYNVNGANQGDTVHYTYVHNGGCGNACGGGGGTGTFPLVLQNNTGGTWASNQIYVTVIGQATPGQWSYLKSNGTWSHINHLEATATGHLTKNGVNYPNMSFTLAQASTVNIPTSTVGGRIYLSVGSPVFIPISQDDQGWGPDLRNPLDPNADVYFDWYEYTYVFNQVPFGGNTTQVDQFGFPMTARLVQTTAGYDSTVGITKTRAQVLSGYQAFVGPAFTGLANQYRIVAPRTSNNFQPGGPQGANMSAYIDQVWAKFTAQQWREVHNGRTYTGQIAGGVLTGTRDDGSPFHVAKPTSTQVYECSGPLALGNDQGGSDTTREVGRDFCAAFHRGVALNPADWYNPAKYYLTSPRDDYAAYFHSVSLNNRSYAFAYDDVADQSSVQILTQATPPTSLTLAIGW
jgi:hypothetical protein